MADNQGVFHSFFYPEPGVYDLLVKGPIHLQKRFTNIEVGNTPGGKNLTVTPLLAGDFDNNNILNIFDLALLLQEYTQLETPVTTANQRYDVSLNNTLNIFDLALVLQNYSELEVRGEE